jgi:hypothetical protein
VVAGAGAIATSVSGGGLAAGGAYIANNISRALNIGGSQAVAQTVAKSAQTAAKGMQTLYQVTSKANAQQIAATGKIISQEGGRNSLVYALNLQPTLAQAQALGARSVETVIRFTTNASFEFDFTCSVDGALRSTFNGPINVFNVIEVGFK